MSDMDLDLHGGRPLSWPQSLYFAVYSLVVITPTVILNRAFGVRGAELAGFAIVFAFGLFWGGFLPLYRRLPSRWK